MAKNSKLEEENLSNCSIYSIKPEIEPWPNSKAEKKILRKNKVKKKQKEKKNKLLLLLNLKNTNKQLKN